MTDYPVKLPLKRPPTHPGALMREFLEEQVKLSKAEAARRMRISRPSLYAILNGTGAVTADRALRFCRLAGGEPSLYLAMRGRIRSLARATAPRRNAQSDQARAQGGVSAENDSDPDSCSYFILFPLWSTQL